MEDRTQLGATPNPFGTAPPTVMGAPPTQMGFEPGRTMFAAPARPLEVECVSGNKYAFAPEVSREHALVVMRAGGGQAGRRAPINVCLCIDRSGSMEGDPLEYVKRACDYVVDMLEPNDILSIVTFEEQVDVIMPARRVVNKPLVKEHIHRLEAGNTTNLYDGLVAACMQIASVMPQTSGYVHRVLLLTDGEPTAGLKDFSSIVQQVADQKARGISVTALGFGLDYNEELMAGIARRSGGNYYHIQKPETLPDVFKRELETLISIVAKNVRLRFHISRWTQIRQVYGMQPAYGPRIVEIAIPDIERGTARTALVELEFDKHPPGEFRVVKAEVIYEDVTNNKMERSVADCVFEFTRDRNLLATGVNPLVLNEREIALASQNLQRTIMGMKTQQVTAMGAMQELQKTRMVLQQAGRTDGAQEVEDALRAVQSGADMEKTIVGTIFNLDQGKTIMTHDNRPLEATRYAPLPEANDLNRAMQAPPDDATRMTPAPNPDSDRTRFGGAVQCPVCRATTPVPDIYCGDCGFLLSSHLAEPIETPDEAILAEIVDEAAGRRWRLRPGMNTIGRQGTDILAADETVSRLHARLIVSGSGVTVEDLGSSNGTKVGDRRVAPNQPTPAVNGTGLRFGSWRVLLEVAGDVPAPASPTVAIPAAPVKTVVIDKVVPMNKTTNTPLTQEDPEGGVETGPIIAFLRKQSGPEGDVFISTGRMTLGRRSSNRVVMIKDAYVSGRHAEITADESGIYLTDLGSTNGTVVNGMKLPAFERQLLLEGDEVQIGQTRYRFDTPKSSEPSALLEAEQPDPLRARPALAADDLTE